MFTVQSTRDQK